MNGTRSKIQIIYTVYSNFSVIFAV